MVAPIDPARYREQVNVRGVEAGDTDGVTEVFLSAISCMTYLTQTYSDAETSDFIKDVLLPNNEVWVAEEAGRVIGFTGFGDGSLNHLWVHRTYQNRGVGTALLKVAMGRCSDGLKTSAFQKNLGARRLYERNGFELVELTNGDENVEHEPNARYVWTPSPA